MVVSNARVVDTVRLVDEAGRIVDGTCPRAEVAELAAPTATVTVEARDGDRVVGFCPPQGVVLGGITYTCPIAPGEEPAITTITEP